MIERHRGKPLENQLLGTRMAYLHYLIDTAIHHPSFFPFLIRPLRPQMFQLCRPTTWMFSKSSISEQVVVRKSETCNSCDVIGSLFDWEFQCSSHLTSHIALNHYSMSCTYVTPFSDIEIRWSSLQTLKTRNEEKGKALFTKSQPNNNQGIMIGVINNTDISTSRSRNLCFGRCNSRSNQNMDKTIAQPSSLSSTSIPRPILRRQIPIHPIIILSATPYHFWLLRSLLPGLHKPLLMWKAKMTPNY
jgi:hypothetical protein